jgi:hypothetical protein
MLVSGLALTVLLAACSNASSTAAAVVAVTQPSLGEGAVRTAGGVRVRVDVPAGGGFVGVYQDESGVPGVRVGATKKLAAGAGQSVEIAAAGSGAVWVLVHRDVNGNGDLDFPGVDRPVLDPSGSVVSELIVAAGPSASVSTGEVSE